MKLFEQKTMRTRVTASGQVFRLHTGVTHRRGRWVRWALYSPVWLDR